jgi:Pyridine nucleotide-disulphide oxidoreductase
MSLRNRFSVRDRTGQALVVGAGPNGLAVAAYLRAHGVKTHVYGSTLGAWRDAMPTGMLLRSRRRASSIANPGRLHTLERWAESTGRKLPSPLPVTTFLDYGAWYQQTAVGDVDPRFVASISPNGSGFDVSLDDGTVTHARHVVVAAGLSGFSRRPAVFDGLSPKLVSHTADHPSLERFAGRRVLVIGGGQSAIESAALLRESGAEVELLARAASLTWLREHTEQGNPFLPPTDVGGRVTGWVAAVPDVYRVLSPRRRDWVVRRCIIPAGAAWLRDRVAGVRITLDDAVAAAEETSSGLELRLCSGDSRSVDHVLLATGYEIDVRRYPFLPAELLERLELSEGQPVLGRGLESSVPGLYFVGAPAVRSFGPLMRFIVGSWYAAPAVAARILRRRQPPLRFSF